MLGEAIRLDIAECMDAMRLWAKSTSFAGYVLRELQSAKGYRTDGTDTRVAVAVCNLWQQSPRFLYAVTSLRMLGKEAGVSPNAAAAALKRLNGWFVVVEPLTDQEGRGAGCLGLTLGEVVCSTLNTLLDERDAARKVVWPTLNTEVVQLLPGVQSTPNESSGAESGEGVQSTPNENAAGAIDEGLHDRRTGAADEYSTRLNDEAFMSGTSPTVKRWARRNAEGEGLTVKGWLEQYTTPGLGEACLRVIDALTRCGEMTAQELAAETSKTLGTVRKAARRLETLHLVEAEREHPRASKVYWLAAEWQATLDELRPSLRTWQLVDWREAKRLEGALRFHTERAAQAAQNGDAEEARLAGARVEKLRHERAAVLARLHPERADAELWRMACDVSKPRRVGRLQRHDPQSELELHKPIWDNWQALDDEADEKRMQRLMLAGWARDEIERTVRHWGPKMMRGATRFVMPDAQPVGMAAD